MSEDKKENIESKDVESKESQDTQEASQTSEDKDVADVESTKASDTQPKQTIKKENYVAKEKFEAVSKNLSEKDKKLSQLEREVEQIRNEAAIKDMLLESDLPEVIKKQVKQNIHKITPDTFGDEVDNLQAIYESGREAYKQSQISNVNKAPEKKAAIGVRDKIVDARKPEDLRSVFENLK